MQLSQGRHHMTRYKAIKSVLNRFKAFHGILYSRHPIRRQNAYKDPKNARPAGYHSAALGKAYIIIYRLTMFNCFISHVRPYKAL